VVNREQRPAAVRIRAGGLGLGLRGHEITVPPAASPIWRGCHSEQGTVNRDEVSVPTPWRYFSR
jgi:hypothetical protein